VFVWQVPWLKLGRDQLQFLGLQIYNLGIDLQQKSAIECRLLLEVVVVVADAGFGHCRRQVERAKTRIVSQHFYHSIHVWHTTELRRFCNKCVSSKFRQCTRGLIIYHFIKCNAASNLTAMHSTLRSTPTVRHCHVQPRWF